MKFEPRVSKQPRKKRLAAYTAPLHLQRKKLGVHVSKELRAKLGARTVIVHPGDTVKVLRGAKAGTSGKVTRVDVKHGRAFVEGIVRRRGGKSGKETPVPLQPSNLLLTQTERKAAAPKVPAPTPGKVEAKPQPAQLK